ncbi:MAG: hypothetical protein COY40_02590 [Alphaproteobacteria bacterium CG_4_10_14_0_8_um_filter_53_9]|nr:MAG: hypothetical protein COY40_02590 [Alphaproteobacteria bacterium CG_4_10_14_0_8_um_filter_53_9]
MNNLPFSVIRGYFAHRRLVKEGADKRNAVDFERNEEPVRAPKMRRFRSFKLRAAVYALSNMVTVLAVAAVLAVCLTPRYVAADMAVYGRTNDLGCLALNSYRERAIADGKEFFQDSSDEELMAFAWVVKNRLDVRVRQTGQAEPETICDVVWAGSETKTPQLSWTAWPDADKFFISEKYMGDFVRSFWAAFNVWAETPKAMAVREQIGWADHYVNHGRANPAWAKRMEKVQTEGFVHSFYIDTTRYVQRRDGLEEAFAIMGK